MTRYWAWLVLCLTGIVLPASGLPTRQPSLDLLVNSSDLIVVGTFKPGTVDSSEIMPYVSGTVTVEEVLWGDMLSFLIGEVVGKEVIQVAWWDTPGDQPINWAIYGGQKGIWLLVRTEMDVYRTDGRRCLKLRNKHKVVRSLRKNMVFIRRTPLSPPMERMVDLVVRNVRRQDAVVPDFKLVTGILRLHPDVSLSIFKSGLRGRMQGKPLSPQQGRLLHLDDEEWIVVGSGEEHLVRLSLKELFDLDKQTSYTVQFQVKGFGKSTLVLPASGTP